MEENQNTEGTAKNIENNHPTCEKHSTMKVLMIGLLIFFGAFCAFYTVADWYIKSLLGPMFGPFPSPSRIERMIEKDMRAMDSMMMREDKLLSKKAAPVIHLEQTKDAYKIIIDLKAFDNNENNLKTAVNGRILTITGRTVRKSKHNEQISEFQQNYMFGDNVKLEDFTKEIDGNNYIITIPIRETEE